MGLAKGWAPVRPFNRPLRPTKIDPGLGVAPALGLAPDRAPALAPVGLNLAMIGAVVGLAPRLERPVLALAVARDDAVNTATALDNLGRLDLQLGDPGLAEQRFTQAVDIHRANFKPALVI